MSRLNSLLKMYEKDKRDPFISYGIALEYLSAGNTAEAEKFLDITLKTDKGYTAAYMQYAQLKVNQNKLQEAKELYQKGIAAALASGDSRSAKEMEEFLEEIE